MTSYATLLDRIIDDGLAEVHKTYADPKDHHKRDGAIEGFEACRDKTPDELVKLWQTSEDLVHQIMRVQDANSPSNIKTYWKQRYKTLQIEWVCNVVSVGLVNNGKPPLLGHLPTARGASKYANIVGVQRTEGPALQ